MRPSNNLENKTLSDTLKISATMYESSCSQFFRTTTGIQSGSHAFYESRLVMIFLTILGVTKILCSFRLVLERKTGKEIHNSCCSSICKFGSLKNPFADINSLSLL